jgi:periplasmic protein TonB
MFTRRLFQVVAAVVLAAAVPGTAQAQDAFERAKSLYLEAAYEDALALLDPSGPSSNADVHLYRALCLLALGRGTEADLAIARSIEVDPTATASRPDVSPRVAALLADARRRMLPDIARARVADGRLAYQQGDKARATERFEAAVRLLDDPALANQAELMDLRTLASGFLDLIRAQATPPPVAASAAASPPPVAAARAAVPPASPPAAASTVSAPAPAAASRTEAPAAPTPAPNMVVTRPVPITQALPPWRPPDSTWSRRELRGSMLLNIDATGRVTSAQMEQPIYPAYDRLLLEAARAWRYQPAMRDGQPTTSQLIVPILLRPQIP